MTRPGKLQPQRLVIEELPSFSPFWQEEAPHSLVKSIRSCSANPQVLMEVFLTEDYNKLSIPNTINNRWLVHITQWLPADSSSALKQKSQSNSTPINNCFSAGDPKRRGEQGFRHPRDQSSETEAERHVCQLQVLSPWLLEELSDIAKDCQSAASVKQIRVPWEDEIYVRLSWALEAVGQNSFISQSWESWKRC